MLLLWRSCAERCLPLVEAPCYDDDDQWRNDASAPVSPSVAMDTETSPPHLQTKAYVRQLQVIDNQNLLFDMSCKLEPKDT